MIRTREPRFGIMRYGGHPAVGRYSRSALPYETLDFDFLLSSCGFAAELRGEERRAEERRGEQRRREERGEERRAEERREEEIGG